MSALAALVLALHHLAAFAILAHVGVWAHLLWTRRAKAPPAPPPLGGEALPRLTLQLPLYNEAEVVEALLACVARLDWPGLHVQVLDDSTDDTPARVAAMLPGLRAAGLRVDHVRRAHREGFKAGALAEGLARCDSELIAILDADFRPGPAWLREAVACLAPDVGLVQCRWGLENRRRSALTRAQGLHLDAHFAVEQHARSEGGLSMGFNGTAGVWRRACIEAAGGWEGDTLTEDLDLAYRAQLAGWRLRYVDEVVVPCALPETASAIEAQQRRWIRGGAQVARKLLPRVWRGPWPLRRRLHAGAHLLASSVFLPVMALLVITPLLAPLRAWGPPWFEAALAPAGQLLRGVPLVLACGYALTALLRERSVGAALARLAVDLPLFLLLVTAITARLARSAWLGWTGPTGTFERTPKGAAERREARRAAHLPPELWLTLWAGAGLALAVGLGDWGVVPFLAFEALAFAVWTALSLGPISPHPRNEPSLE